MRYAPECATIPLGTGTAGGSLRLIRARKRTISATKRHSLISFDGQGQNSVGQSLPSNRVGLSMPKTNRSTPHTRAFRRRLRAAGGAEVLFQLPRETVALLDAIKERHGLRNRSQALLQLIEQKGAIAQQTS
jgi:RNase P protein component